MRVVQHKFTLSFAAVALILFLLLMTGSPLYPLSALVLVLYFPGLCILSFLKKELTVIEVLFLPFLIGISFWIVFSYFVSELNVLHLFTAVVVSFLSSVFTDRQNIHVSPPRLYEVGFLLTCFLFMLSYSYPWSQFFEWAPPGDDMKYHVAHIQTIAATHSLPENYGPLYPEVTTLTYPLGYHIIMAAVSSPVTIASVMISTLLLLPLVCFSFYFVGKTFNEKTGLYSAFSLSFLSLFFHHLSSTATYPNLLGISLQVLGFSFLIEMLKNGTNRTRLLVTALLFAASVETHPYILLLNVFFLFFIFCSFLLKDFSKIKIVTYVGILFLLLSIPYLLRLRFPVYSPLELSFLTEWYVQESIRSFQDLVKNIALLGPLILFFGVFGVILSEKRTFLILWVAAALVIPVLSSFQVNYPGWYTVSPNRFLLYLFAPLCIFCSMFFAWLEETLPRSKFLPFVTIVVLFSVGMHHANLFDSFTPNPVTEVEMNPDDEYAIAWIRDNTPEDSVILNTGTIGDCSSWVPVLALRRVIFPFFSGHRGDNCIEKLKTYEKLNDFQIMRYAPDSVFALQVLEKYGVTHIYIPSWKKLPFLTLYAEPLSESPVYELVAKRGDAYVFRVDYDKKPKMTFFTVMERAVVVKGKFLVTFVPRFSPNVLGKFFLKVDYTDDSYGKLDVSEEEYIGNISLCNTGEEKFMVFPLPGWEKVDFLLHSESDLALEKVALLLGVEDTIKVAENLGLKGKGWVTSEAGEVTAPGEDPELRVYLFEVKGGELVIQYKDTGYGNVDINVSDKEGVWHAVKVIFRQNTGETREVRVPIEGEYTALALGVYVHGEDFTIQEIWYIPS